MSDFSKYFLMINEEDPVGTEKVVIEYTFLKTQGTGKGKIDWDRDSMKAKIPAEHGNLNHVCRVTDSKGHSIYIKQAGLETRISKDMKASLDRNRQESEILRLEEQMAPGMVPHIYFFDTVMCASGMEDCSDFQVMRDAMLEHWQLPNMVRQLPRCIWHWNMAGRVRICMYTVMKPVRFCREPG